MHIFLFKVSKQYCTHASGLYTYIILNAYTYFHYLPKNVCPLKKQSVHFAKLYYGFMLII
jgi:hypothetical protein